MFRKYIKIFVTAAISLAVLLIGILYFKNTSVKACETCHCDTQTINEIWNHHHWVTTTYKCDISENIHGTNNDVSKFYVKPVGDDHHCHRIVWNELGTTKQNDFKAMHHNDHDYSSPNHGNWESAYNAHIDQNPDAGVDVAGHWGSAQEGECSNHNGCEDWLVSGTKQYRFNDSGNWINGDCPSPIDGYFSDWGQCSVPCGGGTKTRNYIQALYCGKDLNYSPSDLTQSCNTETCEQEPSPTPEVTVTPEVTPTEQPSQGGISGGPVGAPSCNDTEPGTPILLSAVALGGNKIKINWTKVIGANNYTIYYGPSSANYLYSVASTSDTDNFTIEGLSKGCFKVNAVNGCQPGDLSSEVCTSGIGGGNVLGASTMGATGSFANNIFQLILLSGFSLIGLGTRKFFLK